MNRPELRPLTSVRGLLAWVIVVYHVRMSCVSWVPAGVMAALARSYFAVDCFFLLSGFVIWLNYGERLTDRAAAADYIVRRLARVWPLHLAILGFAVLIAVTLLATGRDAGHFPFALLPLHVAMMQDWGTPNALLWNDPAWSISAEWAAYLLTPLAPLLFPGRRTWRPVTLLAAAVLSLSLFTAVLALAGESRLGASISQFGVVRSLSEFACGSVLCDLWWRCRGSVRVEIAAWAAGLSGLVAWGAGAPEIIVMPLALASLLLALALGAERPRHPLAGRAIHWLGEVSYATYLSHFLLFVVFKMAVVKDAGAVTPVQISLFLLIVLAASAVLYHVIERPAQRLMLRWWRGRTSVRAPAKVSVPRST